MVASARAYVSALNKMIGWMSLAQKVTTRGRSASGVSSGLAGVMVSPAVAASASVSSMDEVGKDLATSSK